jgi:uncharacterized protein
MAKTDPPAAGVDLDVLDDFLLSDRAPEDSMGLSDLDGFLTAIIIGPELIPPSEWLPVIWGGEEPKFKNNSEAQTILGAIMGRYNEIIANLDADPLIFSPVFLQGPEGHVILTDWAAGFLDAISLRTEAWNPLITHPEARSLIVPMFLIGAGDQLDPELGEKPSADELNKLLEQGEDLVTACVLGIRGFWLEHDTEGSGKSSRNQRAPNVRRRR